MADNPPEQIRFVTDRQAAVLLSVSRSHLMHLRIRGGGPPWVTIGRAVRYRLSDITTWADGQTQGKTRTQEATV